MRMPPRCTYFSQISRFQSKARTTFLRILRPNAEGSSCRHAVVMPFGCPYGCAHTHIWHISLIVCVCVLLRGYIKFNIFISAAPNISPTWRDALPKPKHIHSNIYSLRFIFVHCMRIRFFRTIQVVASELRCKLCADSANTMARWTCR